MTKGQVYEDLVNISNGGIHGSLAQQDFQPIFDAIANQIVINAGQLPCEYLIPDPPMNETLDPSQVNVKYIAGDTTETDILKVDNAGACHPTDGGWYYDNAQAPTKIILCPQSCDAVSMDEMGKMDIVFGCETKIPTPRVAGLPVSPMGWARHRTAALIARWLLGRGRMRGCRRRASCVRWKRWPRRITARRPAPRRACATSRRTAK